RRAGVGGHVGTPGPSDGERERPVRATPAVDEALGNEVPDGRLPAATPETAFRHERSSVLDVLDHAARWGRRPVVGVPLLRGDQLDGVPMGPGAMVDLVSARHVPDVRLAVVAAVVAAGESRMADDRQRRGPEPAWPLLARRARGAA